MFLVADCYGTRKWCIGRTAALEWLAACSPTAAVFNVWGQCVAQRTQVRVY